MGQKWVSLLEQQGEPPVYVPYRLQCMALVFESCNLDTNYRATDIRSKQGVFSS